MIIEIGLRRYKDAILTGKQIIKLRPMNAGHFATVGLLYEKTGDTLAAEKYLKTSLNLYNKMLDTLNVNSKGYKTTEIGKALNLIMLGQQQQGDAIYKRLYNEETNPSLKNIYQEYLKNKSKQQWLDKFFNGKANTVSEDPVKVK